MTAPALLVLVALADTPFDDWIASPEERQSVEAIWRQLEDDKSLTRELHAYAAHLSSAPALASVERTFLALDPGDALLRPISAFEEYLLQERKLLESFAATQTPKAHQLNRTLERLARAIDDGAHRGAIDYLKAYPEIRRTFLRNPVRIQPTPRPLRPLRDRLIRDFESLRRLRNAFRAVDSDPEWRPALQTWWNAVYGPETSDLTELYGELMRARNGRARAWDAWETRNRSWAAESTESLVSAMYVHARVRREAISGADLSAWSEFLSREPAALARLSRILDTTGTGRAPWPLAERETLSELPDTAVERARGRERVLSRPKPPRRFDRNRPSPPEREGRDTRVFERPQTPKPPQPTAPP